MDHVGVVAQALAEKSKLKRVMGRRDLFLFYIATVASMRMAAVSTENGPSVLVLWVLGFILFYVPRRRAFWRTRALT